MEYTWYVSRETFLRLSLFYSCLFSDHNGDDKIWETIRKFKIHPGIEIIKQSFTINAGFCWKPFCNNVFPKVIKDISDNKAAERDITFFLFEKLKTCINDSFKSCNSCNSWLLNENRPRER